MTTPNQSGLMGQTRLYTANVEKLNQILIRSNFKDLTPDTLLEAFKVEGIYSLEDLAKRITTALQDPKGTASADPLRHALSAAHPARAPRNH